MKINKYMSLFEMALSKKQIERDILHLQHTIMRHIIKILLFKNKHELVRKWAKEIISYIEEIQDKKCKMNNNYLSKENYFLYLYIKPLDTSEEKEKGDMDIFRNHIINAIYENENIKSKYDEKTFPFIEWNKKIVYFYKKISEYLEQGKANRSNIISAIEKYFIKGEI